MDISVVGWNTVEYPRESPLFEGIPAASAFYFVHSYYPLPADPAGPVQVKVLGQGCPSCDKLEQDVMAVLAELGLAADLEHVRDIRAIAAYGVMGSPALVIDGKVVAAGKIPSKNQLKEWLKAASKK